MKAGISAPHPILPSSRLSTKCQVGEARANLEVKEANEQTFRRDIYLELQRACAEHLELPDRIRTTELTVRQAAKIDFTDSMHSLRYD